MWLKYSGFLKTPSKNCCLSSVDTSDVTLWIYLLQNALNDTTQMPAWSYYHYEQDRLFALQDTIKQFYNGTVSVINLHKTLVNNFLYDQLNMGSANFVISVFLHFLYRFLDYLGMSV